MSHRGRHALVGLHLDSGCAWAAAAAPGAPPQPLPLDPPHAELPLAVSLERRAPEVGRAGLILCRRQPHLVCLDFLPHLGSARRWAAGRHRLDAAGLTELALARLHAACGAHAGAALAVPSYLHTEQIERLWELAAGVGFGVLGTVAAPLAASLTACADRPWSGPAFLADVDDHALTLAVLVADGAEVRLAEARSWPHLGLRRWKERLLDALADRCIRQSRRDPRAAAGAEQSLYEQINTALDLAREGHAAALAVQGPQWYQNLIVQPDELAAACGALVRQAVERFWAVQRDAAGLGAPGALLLTDAAARLPGLSATLEACSGQPEYVAPSSFSEDFGEGLLETWAGGRPGLVVLAPDAAARAAQALAGRWVRGELLPGHLDRAPLLPPPPPDAGPPRLAFRGREFLLGGPAFTLGRHPACDLVFDSDLYPGVSGRHCEIVFDRRAYTLRDRSRNGTLVNDRPVVQQLALHPGDWIRLGPDGPVLRFLGQTLEQARLTTTA